MNKNGSKGILEDNHKEYQLRSLIIEFDEKHNLKPRISYKDIFDFVKNSYYDKQIDFYPSYTWWKTKGKHLVDEYNMVKKKTIKLTEKEQLDIVEIIDLVEKYYGDREALIKYLLPYNDLVDRLVDRINKLEISIQESSVQLNQKNGEIQSYKDTIDKQNKLIDSFFYTHIGSESQLRRVLELGETTYETINYSLTETFGSPSKYIEEFTKRSKINTYELNTEKDNVIKLNKKSNSSLDNMDYDW